MIEDIDQQLMQWIAEELPDSQVSLLPPADMGENGGIGLYLMNIPAASPTQESRALAYQVILRYLVTSWSQDPVNEHQVLYRLLFAAMSHPTYEVELDPLAIREWRAFGIAPRPCFVLRMPMRMQPLRKTEPTVSAPIQLHTVPMVGLDGIVTGPKQVPIANARVALLTHHLTTLTDFKGRFTFAAVPTTPVKKQFRIQARGREAQMEVELQEDNTKPLIINFDALED